MKEIDPFKAKIMGIKELIIGRINYDCNRLLINLDYQKTIVNE